MGSSPIDAPLSRKLAPVVELRARCADCNLRSMCLPFGLSPSDDLRLESMVAARRRLKYGQALYRAGDRLEALYGIRGGFFKTSALFEDGREQVTGFQMPGEMLGLDGVGTDRYTCDAVALDHSEVCIIPYARLLEVGRKSEPLEHHLFKILGREIARDQSVMLLLGTMHAEERLGAFLLNLSDRLRARGYSPSEFQLRMRREEIGSYLGLTLETVSRTFSKLQQHGLVDVQRRRLRIIDADGLAKLIERNSRS